MYQALHHKQIGADIHLFHEIDPRGGFHRAGIVVRSTCCVNPRASCGRLRGVGASLIPSRLTVSQDGPGDVGHWCLHTDPEKLSTPRGQFYQKTSELAIKCNMTSDARGTKRSSLATHRGLSYDASDGFAKSTPGSFVRKPIAS